MNINHSFTRLVSLLMLLLVSLGVSCLWADDAVHAFGQWNIYNATPQGTQMQVFGDRLFMVNASALTSIDLSLDPDSQQGYSRTTGLSGSSVQFILTSTDANRMAITYDDGMIDLLDSLDQVYCIPDLASKPLSGDKTIYSLRQSHGMLYIAGGFGVIEVDMLKAMILHHYPTDFPVQLAFAIDGTLFRYSERHRLEYLTPGSNGNDPDNWQRVTGVGALRDVLTLTDAEGRDHAYAISADGEFVMLDMKGSTPTGHSNNYQHIYSLGNRLLLQGDLITLYEPLTGQFTDNRRSPYKDCIDYVPAADDHACYMLHPYYGLFLSQYDDYQPGKRLTFEADFNEGTQPNGIATSFLGQMHLTDCGIVGISRRSYTMGLSAANALSGVISYLDTERDEVYNVIARYLKPQIPEGDNFQGLQGFDIDPTNPERAAICSGLFGLFLLDGDSIVACYDGRNSVGQVDAFDPTYISTRVSAVAYDDDGNLFFSNSMQDTLLRCLTVDGQWLKFPNPGMSQQQDASRILLARHGDNRLKWVLNDCFYRKSRIGIYDDGGTLKQTSDDKATFITTLIDQDQNQYDLDYIFGLCEDLDGKVWVLTTNGPFVIEDPSATFRYALQNPGMGKVRRVKIPRNDGTNLADYLMESTWCSCMVVDNFNRKWIGTYGAGLYLMSADCITELAHFDVDNSPLLSSSILDLCYDAASGLLYVSCEGGVLTYQTDAIEGASDFSSLYCYPNPVRPEYSGELRIMGLMNDSQVSITDTAGQLIFRTRSQGNVASYDLRTADGQRLAPGVYLIHAVDSESHTGTVCRFLVL